MELGKVGCEGSMELRFGPNYQKAVQALNFFALKDQGQVNKMKAIKLIFFADRYHLRKYGRPVLGDRYVAMPYGPVASLAKDLAESTVFLAECQRQYVDLFLERNTDNRVVMSISGVDEDVFSDSDIEALEFAWMEFGSFDEFALAQITHAYPEWSKHEDTVRASSCNPPTMAYEDFFADADPTNPLLQPLGFHDPFAMDPGDLDLAKQCAEERTIVESLWSR